MTYFLEIAKMEELVPLKIFTSGQFQFVVLDSLTPVIEASLQGLLSEQFKWKPSPFQGEEAELHWSRVRPCSPTGSQVWMVTGPM